MLPPKAFLEQQFQLLEDGINEALRFEYGPAESGKFFEECKSRLGTLRATASLLPASPSAQTLGVLVVELSSLAALISRIQHSSLGEFPWAFAEELRTLAKKICTLHGAGDPLFFFSSEGELESHGVHDEQEKVSYFHTAIFNIVFPKSLKYNVLVHPVLAHEVGHAYLSAPAVGDFERSVQAALFAQGPLASTRSFKRWLARWYPEAKPRRLIPILEAWREEVACDLIGLVLMGPCFVPAFVSLIGALHPSGVDIGEDHPPPKCRFHTQHIALEELGWIGPGRTPAMRPAENRIWRHISEQSRGGLSRSLVPARNIRTAVRLLAKQFDRAIFRTEYLEQLDDLVLQTLNYVPPVGQQDLSRDIPAAFVDFRAIIYAGWVAWEEARSTGSPSFDQVNRLCELAILQQRGVATASKQGSEEVH
jgi:hypothetical protein